MKSDWKISHSKEFCSFMVERLQDCRRRAGKSDLTEDATAEILREVDDAEALWTFAEALEAGEIDPMKALHLDEDDKGNPVYVLKAGCFEGYYYLDTAHKTGTGVTCRHV